MGEGWTAPYPEITFPPPKPGSQPPPQQLAGPFIRDSVRSFFPSWDTFFLELMPQPWPQFPAQAPGRGPTEETEGEALPRT